MTAWRGDLQPMRSAASPVGKKRRDGAHDLVTFVFY